MFNILMGAALLLLMIIGMNLAINAIARRDGEERPPLPVKLILIPVLILLLLLPLSGFALLYGLFFYSIGAAGGLLRFEGTGDLVTFAFTVLCAFLFFQAVVHPVIVTLLQFLLKRPPSPYAEQFLMVVIDSLILYSFAGWFPGIAIEGYASALSIAVLCHIVDWTLYGIRFLYQRQRRSR